MSLLKPQICLKKAVPGLSGRVNDILVSVDRDDLPSVLVFFGGDVQDLTEVMMGQRDNKRYVCWSLESVAMLLAVTMPNHQVSEEYVVQYNRA